MPTENKPAEPLLVERSTVTKLVITGAPRLDPITVFLEDFGRRDCPTESTAAQYCEQKPSAEPVLRCAALDLSLPPANRR
jgi:hypothetical protein